MQDVNGHAHFDWVCECGHHQVVTYGKIERKRDKDLFGGIGGKSVSFSIKGSPLFEALQSHETRNQNNDL